MELSKLNQIRPSLYEASNTSFDNNSGVTPFQGNMGFTLEGVTVFDIERRETSHDNRTERGSSKVERLLSFTAMNSMTMLQAEYRRARCGRSARRDLWGLELPMGSSFYPI